MCNNAVGVDNENSEIIAIINRNNHGIFKRPSLKNIFGQDNFVRAVFKNYSCAFSSANVHLKKIIIAALYKSLVCYCINRYNGKKVSNNNTRQVLFMQRFKGFFLRIKNIY